MRWIAVVLLALVSLATVPASAQFAIGLSTKWALRKRFESDTGCKEKPSIESGGGGLATVKGCGIISKYVCAETTCLLQEQGDTIERRREIALQEKAREQAMTKLRPRVTSETHANGYPVLRAILPGARLELRVTGAPTMDVTQVLWTARFKEARKAPGTACEHAIVANGEAVPLLTFEQVPRAPASAAAGPALEEYRAKIPMDVFRSLVRAERIVGRTCEVRWELDEASIDTLREFLMRFGEVRALEGPAANAPATPSAPPTIATGSEKI